MVVQGSHLNFSVLSVSSVAKIVDLLFRFQALLQQFGRQFVQAGSAFLRQQMQLLYQFAVQLDRERHQAESLIALALLAAVDHRRRSLTESGGIGRLVYLAFDFLAFGLFEIGFFQGIKLKCGRID